MDMAAAKRPAPVKKIKNFNKNMVKDANLIHRNTDAIVSFI